MKSKKINMIVNIICLGSIWGILEATLGTLLHFNNSMLSLFFGVSTIMISLSSIILYMSIKLNNDHISPILVGTLAALIKLTLLFIPKMRMVSYFVINPAISIFIESIVFAALYKLFFKEKRKVVSTLVMVFAFNIGWRILFLGAQEFVGVFANYPTTIFMFKDGARFIATDLTERLISFFIYKYLVSTFYICLLISPLLYLERKNITVKHLFKNTTFAITSSLLLFAATIAITITFKLFIHL